MQPARCRPRGQRSVGARDQPHAPGYRRGGLAQLDQAAAGRRLEDGTLTLEANSTLARERVTSQYADRLRVISAAESAVEKVEVRAAQSAPRMSQQKPPRPFRAAGGGPRSALHIANSLSASPTSLLCGCEADGGSATVAFNPLFLYGGVGLGKTI